MRSLSLLLCFVTPAAAWEFSPRPLCTLSHATGAADIAITYDAALPEYRLTVTLRDLTWPEAPDFGLIFEGGLPPSIATSRHLLSDKGARLSVTDTGFGNVLSGLETSRVAYAAAGDRRVEIPLDGIAGPLAAFRGCPEVMLSGMPPPPKMGQAGPRT